MNLQFLKSHPFYVIFFVLSVGFFIFQGWLSGLASLGEMLLMTGVFSVCISWILFFIRMIFGKRPFIDKSYIWKTALWMTALQAILHIGLFAFAYYENTLSPASLGRVEITDGVKTVVFQQMSHIASASFYDEVRQDIERASASGYTIFYEGIGTGSEASSKVLDTALGIRFDSGTYTSVADMIGMREQDYRYLFSGIRSLSGVINVDLSLDEVARLYSKLPVSSPEQKPAPIDITRELSGALDALRPEERLTLRYIARSFLNLMLKNNQDFLSSEIGSFLASDIMSVILEDRNEHIAETILSSKSDKIYALYGALHFEGIFQKLQKSNPAWKIVRVESMRPY